MTAVPEIDAPTDEETFNAALNALLRAAHENGVDVKRSWDCRNDGSSPDWDVTVVEVKKRTEPTHEH